MIRLGLAHLFFGKWLVSHGREHGLFTSWSRFIEEFPFARSVAPTQLGLCRNNPPLLKASSTDDLPAQAIEDITIGPRNVTAWYSPDPGLVDKYISAISKYRVELPNQAVGEQDLDDLVWELLDQTTPTWLVGFQDVTSATNERTFLAGLMPLAGVGNTMPIVMREKPSACDAAMLLANLNCLCFDFIARQKVASLHLNFFIVEQLPVLPPASYNADHIHFVVPRTLELACTAWDVQPFFNGVWGEAEARLRDTIENQWRENREATCGHTYDPPEWYTSRGPLPATAF